MDCKDLDFGIDDAYYIWFTKLHGTEQEFWSSSYKKIDYLLSKYCDEYTVKKDKDVLINSMKEIPGW